MLLKNYWRPIILEKPSTYILNVILNQANISLFTICYNKYELYCNFK